MTNLPTIDEMQKWKKRYKLDDDGKAVIDTVDGGEYWTIHGNEAYNLCIDMNKLYEENKELKDEILLLKEGLEAYDNAIPLVCTCSQVRDINSEMSDFKIKQNKIYKEHRVVVKKGD